MEIWQAGFYDWTIRDLDDWNAKANYIRMNPVKARLCQLPEEWPYSSANCKFSLDAVPVRYQNLASGAKAQVGESVTPGLKPRPPKEAETVGNASEQFALDPIPQGLKPSGADGLDVGAKAPTPNTAENAARK